MTIASKNIKRERKSTITVKFEQTILQQFYFYIKSQWEDQGLTIKVAFHNGIMKAYE